MYRNLRAAVFLTRSTPLVKWKFPKTEKCFHGTARALMSSIDPIAENVHHDKINRKFYLETLHNGKRMRSYISYELEEPEVYDLKETFVPRAIRGQGIAGQLAKVSFDFLVKENAKMKLTCTYLQDFLEKNPTEEYLRHTVQ